MTTKAGAIIAAAFGGEPVDITEGSSVEGGIADETAIFEGQAQRLEQLVAAEPVAPTSITLAQPARMTQTASKPKVSQRAKSKSLSTGAVQPNVVRVEQINMLGGTLAVPILELGPLMAREIANLASQVDGQYGTQVQARVFKDLSEVRNVLDNIALAVGKTKMAELKKKFESFGFA